MQHGSKCYCRDCVAERERLACWARLFVAALTGAVVQASSTAQAASFAALAADAAYVEMARRFPLAVPPVAGKNNG